MADTTATRRVRERLAELAAFLEQPLAAESVEETLARLESAVTAAMVQSRAAAQQTTLLLFQAAPQPLGLLAFLDTSALAATDGPRKKELALARERVLAALTAFLKRFGVHPALLRTHAAALATRCQLTARVDASNKVRAAAFSALISALKYTGARLSSEDMQPREYAEKLLNDLKFAKATQTTRGLAVETIGHLARHFPHDIRQVYPQLIEWVEDSLDKQFTTNAPEMLVVKGLVFALGQLLVLEPDRYTKFPDKRQKIYSYLSTVLATTMNGQMSRYHVTKTALRFLAGNCEVFYQEIGANAYVWFSYMQFCCASENKTIKEHSFASSDGVMSIVCESMADSKSDSDKKTFNRIIKEVLPVLNDPDASSARLGFALQGLGKLAGCIKAFLGDAGFVKIEDRLKSYGENLLALNERAIAMKWSIASQYLECIGAFVRQHGAKPLEEGYVSFVGDLLCHVVAAYPRCAWKTKHTIYKSILRIFDALSKGTVVRLLVDRFVYHTLLLTVSNITDTEDNLTLFHPETGNIETRLLYDYEDLWVGLVRIPSTSKFSAAVRQELLDSLFKCILRVMRNLDLSYSYDLEIAGHAERDFGGYTPCVARDHTIMLNLTEFIRRIVPKLPSKSIFPWMPLLIQYTIQRSAELPLVSCFYHISTVIGRVLTQLGFFDRVSKESNRSDSKDMRWLREEYAIFVARVSDQLRFYKDELLVASAECVLTAPLSLISIDMVVPALLATLSIGKSYMPAAEIGVSTLERWHRTFPEELEVSLPSIIPQLSLYLSRPDDDIEAQTLNRTTSQSASTTTDEEGLTEFGKLQRRILVLLGSLGGVGSLLISKSSTSSSSQKDIAGRCHVPQFQLPLELSDVSIALPLGKIIAQIGDVAVHDTDRRIKIGACETYHALVCYLCGKTATHPHSSDSKSVFHQLWKKAFPTLLALATDPEKVCRALFEPLLFQVVRWFGNSSETYPFEHSMLLEKLVAGLSQAESNAVREVSGKAFAALLSASIDHDDKSGRSMKKAEVLFERLFALCRHPSSFHRIGAATAIHYVMRSLNQDNSEIISAFALRCIKTFLSSLRLCDRDDQINRSGMDTARGIIERAVLKLERVIVRFPHLFMRSTAAAAAAAANRSVSSSDGSLEDLTKWLFAQTMKRERSYRRMCQTLFVSFASVVSVGGSKRWILDYSEQGADVASVLAPMDSLARVLSSSAIDSVEDADATVDWMEQFSASLESYTWCIQLLGEKSSMILSANTSSTAIKGSALKRKIEAQFQSGGDDGDDRQHTFAWSVSAFLAFECPCFVSSDAAGYRRCKRVAEAYSAALASLCHLISLTVTSVDGQSLTWLIDMESGDFQQRLSRRVVEFLAADASLQWKSSIAATSAVKDFCRAVMNRKGSLANHLRSAATAILDPMIHQIDRLQDLNANEEDSSAILRTSAFVIELVEADLFGQQHAIRYRQIFADAAFSSMRTISAPVYRDRLTPTALKAALLCGWNIALAFRDGSSQQHFATIYNDIVVCLPTKRIWRECADNLIEAAVNDVRVLRLLADVFDAVARHQVFPPASPEWDEFIDRLLPTTKRFVQNIRVRNLELQHQRTALQVLGHLVKIYQGSSWKLQEILWMGPLPDIQDVIIDLLSCRETSYLVKADTLNVLTHFAHNARGGESAQVMVESLNTFMAEEFPIVSSDVKFGTKEYDVFSLLFRQLLLIIEESCCVAFLQLLYPSLKEGSDHLFASDLSCSLARFADNIASGSSTRNDTGVFAAVGALDKADSSLLNLADILLDQSVDVVIRKALLESVFIPIVELQRADVMRAFFLSKCRSSPSSEMKILNQLSALIVNSAEVTSTGSFFSAAVAYALVEMLFRLADPEFIRNEINTAFLGHTNGKGREFTMLVCKSASKMVTKEYAGDISDTTRFACCEAYNCLLTAVSKTQKQEKFFDQILFQESLWRNIIDLRRQYVLRAQTGQFTRIPLTALSASTLKVQQQSQEASAKVKQGRLSRDASSALQFFTGSSLSQTASLRRSSTFQQTLTERQLSANGSGQYGNLEIELDAINEHSCMIPLLRVLVIMKDEFGANWKSESMPGWMQRIFNVVANSFTELNIRLFLVKMVLNAPGLFVLHAAAWLEKILETVLEATCSVPPSKIPEFNYLLRDCCQLVLGEWKDVSLSSMRGVSSRFVAKMIELSPHSTAAIMRDNIRLVTQLIVSWKDAVVVDVAPVEKLLFSDEQDARLEMAERVTALQILSAMVTAGSLDNIQAEISLVYGRSITDGIVLALQHKRATVYTVAAEVCGLYLKHFQLSSSDTLARAVAEEVVKVYNGEDYGRFLALLRNVSLHDPRVIDAMMLQRLCSLLPRAIPIDSWSRLASESLEHASKNPDITKLLFPSIQPVLNRFINHRDAAVQYAILRVMECISGVLNDSDLELVFRSTADGGVSLLSHYRAHSDANCRKLMYSMAMQYFRKDMRPTVKACLHQTLLGGLSDDDPAIREEILTFWNASEMIPTAPSRRLVELFDSLHAPELADKWVYYATNLLVLMTKSTSVFDAPLFPSALSATEFHDTEIDVAWEGKTQTMAPMFSVESDKFVSSRAQGSGSLSQDFLASLTHDPLIRGTIHHSQLVSASRSDSKGGASQLSQYGSGSGVANRNRRRRFTRETVSDAMSASRTRSSKQFFKEQYALLRKQQEAAANRQRASRKQQVAMKRKYRVGDYPDIQIKLRDIIEPIMLLCESHAATSSLIFADFFSSIVLSPEFQHSGLIEQLVDRIQTVMSSSKTSPIFVECLHQAYLSTIIANPRALKDLAVPAAHVGGSTLASGNYPSGELIMEELLSYHLQVEGRAERIASRSDESVAEYRDQLYKVLATVQSSNLLMALASSCCTVDESKAALQARISGDLPLAIASYKKAESVLAAVNEGFDEDMDKLLSVQFEAQRCYWERMECLERLNHWDKLELELLQSEGEDLSFIWKQEPPYFQQGLGHCARTYVGGIEKHRHDPDAREEHQDKIRAFLETARSKQHVWDVLASQLSTEVLLMYLELGEVGRVRALIETFFATFLTRWQNTSAAATLPRLDLMQALSSIVQIDEILTLTQSANDQGTVKNLEHEYIALNRRWTRAHPSGGYESMNSWSRFYMVQSVIGAFLLSHGEEEGILSKTSKQELLQDGAQVMLQYAKAAVSNDFLALASKYLKEYREVCNQKQLPKVSALMINVFVSHVLKLAERHMHKSHASADIGLEGALSSESITAISRYYQAAARMFDNDDILTVMENSNARERVAIGELEARAFGTASQFYLIADHDHATAKEYFTRSLDVFERSCRTAASEASTAAATKNDQASLAVFRSCRLSFVEFLVDLLFKHENDAWEEFVERESLTRLLVENVLEGMAMGDQECSNYLPQLCEAIVPYPALVMLAESELLQRVPMWTCLRWAAQLMALLNGPISGMIVRVLEKMASEYSAALFYDFKVTCGGNLKGFKVDLSRLAALIADPVTEKFVEALRLVHHPELRLKEGLREVAKCLDASDTSTATDLMEHLWVDCFATDKGLLGGQIGRYNREWARKTRPHMEKLLGKSGRNVTPKAVAAARAWIMNNFSVAPGRYGIAKDMKARLVDFAEWLDEFDHTKYRLELPGQYGTYWGKPDPSTHVRILSFSSTLGVLGSKQLPKQITLHCSDEKDYKFLVKGGEDLRLDQRIEQLFDVMNQILHASPRCRDRSLVARTYKVIPMTQEIGMIEWLHSTTTLKSLIESRLQSDDRCADLASNKRQKLQLFTTTAAKQYEAFLHKQRGASFCAKVIAPTSAEVKANFESVQRAIPGDLLRRQLFDMSASFESFLAVRDEFAKSLAVFSACSYILGIGDRHLDNFLLDLRSGALVGIDFGVSFGAGASVLPVPELIPFRYTRQMERVFQPYDGANLLTQDMQAVFAALRDRKQVVESVMNVFLHEPLLDWQKSTVTYQKEIFESSSGSSASDDIATFDDSFASLDRSSSAMDVDEEHPLSERAKGRAHSGSRKSLGSANNTNTSTSTSSSGSRSASSRASAAPPSSLLTPSAAWLPDVKIAIARRKLGGFSPQALLKEELAQNPHLSGASLKKFHTLVDTAATTRAGTATTVAAQHWGDGGSAGVLSPLAQSEALLALATSPDLLGRTYHGWMPWL